MRLYSVFETKSSSDSSEQPQRTLVPEGFSWSAYVFGPFWVIYHRLWMVGIVYLISILTVFLSVWFLSLSSTSSLLLIGLVHFLLGLEGFQLMHVGRLQKHGCSALVVANNTDDAELCFYASTPLLLDKAQSMASPQMHKKMAPADILGLFSSTSKL